MRQDAHVRDMQRLVVAPGSTDVELDAGDHVGFLEQRSVINGVEHTSDHFTGSCSLADAKSHDPVELRSTTATTSYSFGSYAGTSAFAVTAPHDGWYHLVCTGDGSPVVIALGDGIGALIMISVVVFLASMGATLVIALRIRSRRKRGA